MYVCMYSMYVWHTLREFLQYDQRFVPVVLLLIELGRFEEDLGLVEVQHGVLHEAGVLLEARLYQLQCVYVCIVYMYVCICMYYVLNMCIYMYMFVCMYVLYMYIYMYMYSMYVCMNV